MKRPALRLGLAFFGFTLIGAQSGAIGVLIPDLSSFYHVSDAVIGSLFFVSSIGYFISAFTSSLLLERLGLRRFMLIGICMFFGATLVFGLKPPFAVLLLMRLFLGLGMAIFPWLAGVLAQGIGIWSLLPYIIALTALMILSWGILFYSVAKA